MPLPESWDFREVNSTPLRLTLKEDFLSERIGTIPPKLMAHVDAGLNLVLDL